MDSYYFREKIKDIVKEATTKKYSESILNYDLDRAISEYEDEIRDDERTEAFRESNIDDEYDF